MRRFLMMTALVAVCLSGAVTFVRADDAAKASDRAVTNAACPMDGAATNAKYRVEYEGQYVYFCDTSCADAFKADPKAAIAKLSAEDTAAIEKNTTCPISGEKIESFTNRSESHGKLVYFCCEHCKAKFDKEHPAT